MKIFAVGRNYVDHAKELGNEVPTEPIIFMKPETALLQHNAPFYYPSFSQNIHFEIELLIKISKEGKNIDAKFAHKYYDEIGIGIDFTARDLQDKAKSKGLPWEIAKAFNGSAPISTFYPISDIKNLKEINFQIQKNGVEHQSGNSKYMIFDFDALIAYISQFFTLKKGDIIFTGTPAGVGPVTIGDVLDGYLEGNKVLTCEIK